MAKTKIEQFAFRELQGTHTVVYCKTRAQFVRVSELCNYRLHERYYHDIPEKSYISMSAECFWKPEAFEEHNKIDQYEIVTANKFTESNHNIIVRQLTTWVRDNEGIFNNLALIQKIKVKLQEIKEEHGREKAREVPDTHQIAQLGGQMAAYRGMITFINKLNVPLQGERILDTTEDEQKEEAIV